MSKKLYIAAMFAAALVAGAAHAQPAETALTREEVMAELGDWKKARLDELSRGGRGPDTFSPQYRAAYERYVQLRQGENYRAPVGLTRAQVQADLQMWNRAGLGELVRGEGSADFSNPAYQAAYTNYLRMIQGERYQQVAGLTRAEVLADLQAWRRAGLDQWGDKRTPDTASPAYRESLSIYQRLRR